MSFILSSLLLLLVVTRFDCAHVPDASSESHASETISLHNYTLDEVESNFGVVENWSLVCEQLCRSDLGGPACDPHCPKEVVNAPISSYSSQDDQNLAENAEFCGALCDNNLGGSKCQCRNLMTRSLKSFDPSARNVVCTKYCKSYKRTLKGCSLCPLEIKKYQPPYVNNNRLPSAEVPLPVMVPQPQSEIFQFGAPQVVRDVTIQTETTPSTTPDWSKLCSQLCRNGQGGVLCNCDLPPF